jgi:hypothetical protein
MHRQRRLTKRYGEELEKASHPEEIKATDLIYLKGARQGSLENNRNCTN